MQPEFMRDPTRRDARYDVGFSIPPRAEYRAKNFRAEIVRRGDDLIYQFFNVRHPDFQGLLAEIIEAHFGKTDAFSAAFVPELNSLGVRAKGVCDDMFFNYAHYTEKFLELVDNCLQEVSAS
jgi:hypothetical protein